MALVPAGAGWIRCFRTRRGVKSLGQSQMNIQKIRSARPTGVRAGILLVVTALAGMAQEKQLPKYPDAAAAEHAGEEAIVTGRVVAVAKSRGGTTYMNFGEVFPRQTFSGVVRVRD